MNKPKRANPLWETIVLFTSFALLWVWFIASQIARHTAAGRLSPIWQIGLGVVLIVLVVVTVRRMNRVRRAFSGEGLEGDENEPPTGLPPYPGLPPNPGPRR